MTEVTSLLELTDEELEAVEEAPQRRLVPLPWLMTLSQAQVEGAVAAGLRSLTGRGLIAVAEAGTSPVTEFEIEMDPTLADVVEVRAHASAVSLWTVAGGGGWSIHGFLARHGALVEEVSPAGRHRFAMTELTSLSAVFGAFADLRASERDDEGVPIVHFGILLDRVSGPMELRAVAADSVPTQFPADGDWQ